MLATCFFLCFLLLTTLDVILLVFYFFSFVLSLTAVLIYVDLIFLALMFLLLYGGAVLVFFYFVLQFTFKAATEYDCNYSKPNRIFFILTILNKIIIFLIYIILQSTNNNKGNNNPYIFIKTVASSDISSFINCTLTLNKLFVLLGFLLFFSIYICIKLLKTPFRIK